MYSEIVEDLSFGGPLLYVLSLREMDFSLIDSIENNIQLSLLDADRAIFSEERDHHNRPPHGVPAVHDTRPQGKASRP